ncbi:hypothetical protein GCM10010246_06760 [Streptomyces cuspidosporus]|uniref:Uncharacterized protein n=1 Tax=Streptomyces cuspidosporus TaxID=66882 RepID=A0ABN3FCX1_9ACTN
MAEWLERYGNSLKVGHVPRALVFGHRAVRCGRSAGSVLCHKTSSGSPRHPGLGGGAITTPDSGPGPTVSRATAEEG